MVSGVPLVNYCYTCYNFEVIFDGSWNKLYLNPSYFFCDDIVSVPKITSVPVKEQFTNYFEQFTS